MTPDDVMGLRGFFDDVPKSAGSASLLAWNPATQKKAWEEPVPGANNGGVMATAGGLVFQGQSDGKFVAHDANTGKLVWSFDMGVGSMRSEEHTSELQSLMRISYAVFCLKKKKEHQNINLTKQ